MSLSFPNKFFKNKMILIKWKIQETKPSTEFAEDILLMDPAETRQYINDMNKIFTY